jgi:hypothetical protein
MSGTRKLQFSTNQIAHALSVTRQHAAKLLAEHGLITLVDVDELFEKLTARGASPLRRRLADPAERERVGLRFAAAAEIDRLKSQIRELKKL